MYLVNPTRARKQTNGVVPCDLCKKKYIGALDSCTRYTVIRDIKKTLESTLEFMYVCKQCNKQIEKQKGIIDG